jgi:hypothetical protein
MRNRLGCACTVVVIALILSVSSCVRDKATIPLSGNKTGPTRISVQRCDLHDQSPPLASLAAAADDAELPDRIAGLPRGSLSAESELEEEQEQQQTDQGQPPIPAAAAAIEQTQMGARPAAQIIASFDGLGFGFEGPQGTARLGNPSDNSLAVGPDHIVQIVNSKMAVFTKKGAKFDQTGHILYGPVNTNNVFKGFGDGAQNNNGDAVVRYDQLADRWLIVMPIFRRLPHRANSQPAGQVQISERGVERQPGLQSGLDVPAPTTTPATVRGRGPATRNQTTDGAYAICYAISTSSDPLGSYYRYQFNRPLFPDYPRPAVWPDGYYVTTSTGDTVIQKHAFVVDRARMLIGEDATEQGFIINGVNFLINADLDGRQLPPDGAPSILLAAGGAQLKGVLEDDALYAWKFHVDWNDPTKSNLQGPTKIPVAPYHYLGGGQLSRAVPQPGTDRRLDSQGDKLMSRVVYRRIGQRESVVAVHSISTSGGGGGVRWYELRVDASRNFTLHQQGTYAPGGAYRWMASPAIDASGNIGIGYSFGSSGDFPGQRFAGRLADDPPGLLTLAEAVLVDGEAAQTNTLRWEDYAQTAVDPSDDRTIWYVGDYLKKGATSYSSSIGAFRLEK